MSTDPMLDSSPIVCAVRRELGHLRSHWWWLLVLGIVLLLAGSVAVIVPAATAMTSLAAVVFFGVLLMGVGASIIAASFWAGRWSGFLVQLLVGIVYFIAGLTIAELPGQSTVLVTLLLATLFMIGGIFRAVAALTMRFPHWGWTLLNGVVTFVLGAAIYRHVAEASLWLIGTLIGVDMLLHGLSYIMLAVAIRRLPLAER
jgi:uncharacterized membrane protein HdeD (DUF308 family)